MKSEAFSCLKYGQSGPSVLSFWCNENPSSTPGCLNIPRDVHSKPGRYQGSFRLKEQGVSPDVGEYLAQQGARVVGGTQTRTVKAKVREGQAG